MHTDTDVPLPADVARAVTALNRAAARQAKAEDALYRANVALRAASSAFYAVMTNRDDGDFEVTYSVVDGITTARMARKPIDVSLRRET